MNIVDAIKDQLAQSGTQELGQDTGIGGLDLEKLVGAGLPTILSGLKGLASSGTGADKLAESISQVGSTSNASSGAGGILSDLIGGKVIDLLAGQVAKYLGLSPEIVKKGLLFLTPIVMGAIGKAFSGSGKPRSADVSRFFSEQASNIDSALPKGLSFSGIPGLENFGTAAKVVTEETPKTLGKLLVPIAVLLSLLASAYLIVNSKKESSMNTSPKATEKNGDKKSEESKAPIRESSEAPPNVTPKSETTSGDQKD